MSNTPSCFVVQIDLERAEKLRAGLESQGFTLTQPPYTLFQGKKKGVSCTLYTSGKLTVQGSEMKEFIEFYLEPEILHVFAFGYENLSADLTPRMGVDEAGKGDFFGPLSVAGVYADEKQIPLLGKMGVKDSKKLNDRTIIEIAHKIRKECAYHIVQIGPKRYNELYAQFGNLNLLLGWGHATVIENLIDKTGCTRVIIDKFAAEYIVESALKKKKREATLIQRTHAEEDLVVAAASILARANFLEGMAKLEEMWHLPFPKGAGPKIKEVGRLLVKKHGREILQEVAKVHFKTSREILEQVEG